MAIKYSHCLSYEMSPIGLWFAHMFGRSNTFDTPIPPFSILIKQLCLHIILNFDVADLGGCADLYYENLPMHFSALKKENFIGKS